MISSADTDIALDYRAKQAVRESRRQLYFIEAPSVELVKIGYALNVDQRFACINVASPVPLVLLGALPGARRHEMALHALFIAARVRGEWFQSAIVGPFVRRLIEGSRCEALAELEALCQEAKAS